MAGRIEEQRNSREREAWGRPETRHCGPRTSRSHGRSHTNPIALFVRVHSIRFAFSKESLEQACTRWVGTRHREQRAATPSHGGGSVVLSARGIGAAWPRHRCPRTASTSRKTRPGLCARTCAARPRRAPSARSAGGVPPCTRTVRTGGHSTLREPDACLLACLLS